jgi:D-alanine-D-alanine ligase
MNSSGTKATAKKRVAVLRGGPSSEHAISISSGKHVLESLDSELFVPIDIYIDKSGVWHLDGVATSPYAALQFVDVVFNAMHGEYGEDGSVQALLEELGVAYNGTGVFGSRIAIDKHSTALLLAKNDIKIPRSHVLRPFAKNADKNIAEIWRTMQHPLIVKPAASGSSVALALTKDFKHFEASVKKILQSGHSALVQEYIKGREVSVNVIEDMRGQDLYTTIPVTVKHSSHIFDNVTKKSGNFHVEPMKSFSAVERELVTRISKHVHQELGLRHYSRSDFIINEKGIYFIEVNTLPGLTKHSILPAALTESGISMKDFLSHVLERVDK